MTLSGKERRLKKLWQQAVKTLSKDKLFKKNHPIKNSPYQGESTRTLNYFNTELIGLISQDWHK